MLKTHCDSQASSDAVQALTDHPHTAGELLEANTQHLQRLVPFAEHWFCWGDHWNVPKVNKATGVTEWVPKGPGNPNTQEMGDHGEPGTAGTFAEAAAQVGVKYRKARQPSKEGGRSAPPGSCFGVGVLMTTAAAGFVGLDFDDVRDPNSGEVNGMGAEVVKRFAMTYVEVSPSGKGLRVFCLGTINASKTTIDGGSVEVYPAGAKRFLRVTGALVAGCAGEVVDGQAGLDWLAGLWAAAKGGAANDPAIGGDAVVAGAAFTSASSPATEIEQWFAVMRERRPARDSAEVLAGMQAVAAGAPRGKLAMAMKGDALPWAKDESSMDFFLFCEVIRRGCDSLEDMDTVLMATGAKRAKWSEKRGGFGDVFTQTVYQALKSEVTNGARPQTNKRKEKIKANVEAVEADGGNLTTTGSGKAKPTLLTAVTVIHALAPGLFYYDEFKETVYRARGVSELGRGGSQKAGRLTDDDLTRVAMALEASYGMEYKKPQDISPAVYVVAKDNRRNPVADQLRALADVWQQSGKPDVLGDWLEKYMAAETAGIEDYVSKIGRICLMQAARLVFRDEVEERWGLGTVKAQSMPVFISNGGQSKGKALEVLAGAVGPNLYTANKFNIGDAKDVVETLSRFLVVEWAEYGGSKDTAAFKQGMTNPFFTVRRPWATESEDFARRFSLFATSNESEIITDPSRGEARRLWPIYTVWGRSGDEVGLRKAAPMLWGQAAWLALNTDERHWIDDQNPDRMEAEVIRQWDAVIDRCRVSGPTEEKLDEFLRKWAASSNWMSQMVSSNDVARAAGAVDPYTNTPTTAEFRAVSRLMVARGMRRIQMPGTRAKGWTMPDAARENLKPNTSD